jgi:tetratricopeptide (TPR) repeat protein
MTRWGILLACLAAGLASGQISVSVDPVQAGAELLRHGRYSDAEKQFQEALANCDPTPCPELPTILNGLGSLYYELGRYREAEPLLLRAVELLKQPEADTRLLAAALGNLAAVYRIRGRFADAKPLYEQARMLEAGEGGSGLESSSLLARLALLAQDMGDLPAAAELIRRALDGFVKNGAQDTPEGAKALATWAAILESQGNPEQAEEELKHALAIREQISGPNDIMAGDALNTLGISYSHRNRWAEAEWSLRRSVAILRMYPPSPVLAAALNNLGSVLRARGRGREAEESIRQAVAMWELLLGSNHPNVAAGLTNLAVSLQARGRYTDAARLLDRARSIDERIFPANHPRIGIDLSRAGALAKSRKRYAEAEDLLRRADAVLESSLPSMDQEVGAAVLNLADVFRLQKKREASAEMYKRGLAIVTAAWGPYDARLAPWLDGYVIVLRDQKEFAEAAKLEIQATRIRVTQTIKN